MAAILSEPTFPSREQVLSAFRPLIEDLDRALQGAYARDESVDENGYPVVTYSPASGPFTHRRLTLQKAWWLHDELPIAVDWFSNVATRVRIEGSTEGGWSVFTTDGVRMRMPWTPEAIRTLADDLLHA